MFFNTLASLQHWVQTQDPRAATLLEALTGYLRATLPIFGRALQPAADELQAVRLYLQVMQARLGQRLAWRIDVEPALLAQTLPPGLLLTLVENAIEHGTARSCPAARCTCAAAGRATTRSSKCRTTAPARHQAAATASAWPTAASAWR